MSDETDERGYKTLKPGVFEKLRRITEARRAAEREKGICTEFDLCETCKRVVAEDKKVAKRKHRRWARKDRMLKQNRRRKKGE